MEISFWLATGSAACIDFVEYQYTSVGSDILEPVRACTSRGGIPAAEQPEEAHLWAGKRMDMVLLRILSCFSSDLFITWFRLPHRMFSPDLDNSGSRVRTMAGERVPSLRFWCAVIACYARKRGEYSLIEDTSTLGVKVITTLLLPTSQSAFLQ